jgi:hypothetical protein
MISCVISHYHHEGWTHGFIQVVEKAVHVDIFYCFVLYYTMLYVDRPVEEKLSCP